MKKTILAIGITILFIGMSFNSISGIQIDNKPIITSNRGNTLYVGGSGPNNYTRIQDAIDDASHGDTVFVYDDSSPYYQKPEVNKRINLIGENKETTIIDGNKNGDVVAIRSSYINLSGFTIRNSGEYPKICAGVEIFNRLKYVNVFDNILSNNYQGIDNRDNSYISIYDNIFLTNVYGIDIFYGKSCSMHNNIFIDNKHGINGEGPMGSSNLIFKNEFRDNSIGIYFFRYQKAEIYNNNFINNSNKHAYFECDLGFYYNYLNKQDWHNNYWDDCNSRILRLIEGRGETFIFKYRMYDIDWFPAKEPYDI
jgi:nitrous oxidase accessory protein NosD